MRRFALSAVVVLFVVSVAVRAAEPWKYSVNSSFVSAVNLYTNNWIGGEFNSVNYTAQIFADASRQFTPLLLNKHALKLAFGKTMLEDTLHHWKSRKSTDLIDYESLLLLTLHKYVDPYFSARLISEFLDQSQSANTRYFNPLDISEGLGVHRDIRKSEALTWDARIGLLARQFVDRHHEDLVGNFKTNTTASEGIDAESGLKTVNSAKTVTFSSLLRVYEALLSSDSGSDWRYPVVDWNNLLTVNITKYVIFNWNAQLLYEKKLDKNPRLKNVLSVGLSYAIIH
jgi:hypothetical protein